MANKCMKKYLTSLVINKIKFLQGINYKTTTIITINKTDNTKH